MAEVSELISDGCYGSGAKVNQGRLYSEVMKQRLNPNMLNASFVVFVEILLDKTTPNVLDDFIDAVLQYPEIVECHMVSGGFDFLVKIA